MIIAHQYFLKVRNDQNNKKNLYLKSDSVSSFETGIQSRKPFKSTRFAFLNAESTTRCPPRESVHTGVKSAIILTEST